MSLSFLYCIKVAFSLYYSYGGEKVEESSVLYWVAVYKKTTSETGTRWEVSVLEIMWRKCLKALRIYKKYLGKEVGLD